MEYCGVAPLKQQYQLATVVAILKRAKFNEQSPLEYISNMQIRYIRRNMDNINPDIVQRYLHFQQQELISTLLKGLPPCKAATQHKENNRSSSDGSLVRSVSVTRPQEITDSIISAPFQIILDTEDSNTKNVSFLKSFLTLSEEFEQKNVAPTSFLHPKMSDELELTSKLNCIEDSFISKNNQLTEDSGLGYSEGLSERRIPVKTISCGKVFKYSLKSAITQDQVALSLIFVLKELKKNLDTECEEMFYNWKRSQTESAFNVIKKISHDNIDCREILINFISEVLGDCWQVHQTGVLSHSEIKILIIDQLIWDPKVCDEVLQEITEKMLMFNNALARKQKNLPMLGETLGFLLNLYQMTCEKVKVHKEELKTKASKKLELEGSKVRTASDLWMENWCSKESESDCSGLTPKLDYNTEIVETVVIQTESRFPLISLYAREALKAVKSLNVL